MKRFLFIIGAPVFVLWFGVLHVGLFVVYAAMRMLYPLGRAWHHCSFVAFFLLLLLLIGLTAAPLFLLLALLVLWLAGKPVRHDYYLSSVDLLNYQFRLDMKRGFTGRTYGQTRET